VRTNRRLAITIVIGALMPSVALAHSGHAFLLGLVLVVVAMHTACFALSLRWVLKQHSWGATDVMVVCAAVLSIGWAFACLKLGRDMENVILIWLSLPIAVLVLVAAYVRVQRAAAQSGR
jgi:hypothetical protein